MITLTGQLSDSFVSSELSDVWKGDRDDFIISDDARLQLMASEAGQSQLFAAIRNQDTLSIQCQVEMDFNPSGSNNLEIALWSFENEEMADGLFLQVGETGSDDDLELIMREGGLETILATGNMGELAMSPILDLDVVLTHDQIIINYDISGLRQIPLVTEISQFITLGTGYFGFNCEYTSTRTDKYFFDDVYIGKPIPDTISPSLIESELTLDSLQLTFSEELDTLSILFDQTLIITPNVDVDDFRFLGEAVTLYFNFLPGVDYQIDIIDVQDLAKNSLDTTFVVSIPIPPSEGDLQLNEILFDPYDGGGDFVELVNVSDRPLSINGIVISNQSNGDEEEINSDFQVAPNSFVVITEDGEFITSFYPNYNQAVVLENDLPRFSNSSGNVTISFNDIILDEFGYDEDDHNVLLDETEGVSLERISLVEENNSKNWTSASSAIGYATPGLPNSARLGAGSSAITISQRQKTISPNGDQFNDELIIDYQLDKAGYIGRIEIFSDAGQKVEDLISNEVVATTGSFQWGGTCSGALCNHGIYIVAIEFIHPEGDVFQDKLTVGLIRE